MNRARGFTLMEALAMLVFIAIVIPTVLNAVSVATQTAGATSGRLEATLLAEAKLEEILATRTWRQGNAEGDFVTTPSGEPLHDSTRPELARYRWKLIVEDGLDTTVRQLRVRVTWEQRGHVHSVELATLVREEGV